MCRKIAVLSIAANIYQ